MDKVTVIGGSGFIGSHTADVLSKRGYSVVIFDRVKSPWLRQDQTMIVGDILNKNDIERAIQGSKYVYYFAGVADIKDAKRDPVNTINLNIMGIATAMNEIVKANVDRFIYASTMYVYSDCGSFYRVSKQSAEAIIEVYCEENKLDYTFLRYGSLYGARAQDWNGLRSYIKQIILEKQIFCQGDGNERREYIHVEDAALLSVDILVNKYRNQAITVTGQQVLSFNELVDVIFDILQYDKKVIFHKNNLNNNHYKVTPYTYLPKKAKKIIPGEFVDIGQGILEVIDDIYKQLEENE